MQVIKVWNITREDNSEYTKTFFDNGYTAVLEKDATRFVFITPSGRKCTSNTVCDKAVKAINNYYDQAA